MPSRKFARGVAEAKERSGSTGDFAAFAIMPDDEKERLCRALLSEFGVTSIARVSERGEMVHSCCLPFGGHRSGDSNPSASLNYQRLTYNCLGCGNSGGLLWFIASCRGTDSEQARAWLTTETGIGGEQDLSALLNYFDAVWSPKRVERPPLPKLDPRILDPWKRIHPYMTEIRHIPVETLMRFNVGYNPNFRIPVGDEWVTSERIVFPHFWKSDLVGWQSRRLVNDRTPKYVNSPDFPKDFTIYNYQARERVVVVESPMSVLSKYLGPFFIEATFGAKVTDAQIRLLAVHPRVTLFMDNDEAGWSSTKRVGEKLQAYTDVLVVENPYSDCDAANLRDDDFDALVSCAVPFSIWSRPRKMVTYV